VGSDCNDARAFSAAVASACTVFDMGAEAGFRFTLLDIGGGFPGQKSAFGEVHA
jgi:ornithine decarboxylase